jgi:hypothetical protein
VLSVAVVQEGDSRAGALVELGAGGNVARVTVPTSQRDGWAIPRAISAAEIEAALRTSVATAGVAVPK